MVVVVVHNVPAAKVVAPPAEKQAWRANAQSRWGPRCEISGEPLNEAHRFLSCPENCYVISTEL